MGSPYPLAYDIRWPFLHLRPSTRRHVELARWPLAHDLAPHDGRDVARVTCFGDLMGLTGDRVPRFAGALAEVLARADLVIGNCEAPVTHAAKDPRAFYVQRFRMATAYLREVFDRLAIDPARTVLSVANNHSADQGAEGARRTRELLGELGVTAAGTRESPVVVREVRGLRIGVAAWTEWMNCGTVDVGVMRTAEALDRDWRATRDQLALDTLVASPHWEWEFQHFPSLATVAQARLLARAGFDAIAGHHPHVVQPIAVFEHTVCQFSLGNLLARTLTWPHRLFAVLELDVALHGPARGRVVGYRSHPFVQLPDELVPLAAAPARLRRRMEDRLGLMFCEARISKTP